ncbi:unnamed protein product [Phytomonas sp. EM1]|nr:unnamed protein product [Phytomonas sp. EM1]|eukprot:CCW64635.1 unnamed protein product [Phytomonas sp. isolate EM1]
MKYMLANISNIMDCVPCEKCRVWGKLAIKGLATATEINMNCDVYNVVLNRAEKFTLINLARQLSFSVKSLDILEEICRNESLI